MSSPDPDRLRALRRRAARLALYLSLGVTALAALGVARFVRTVLARAPQVDDQSALWQGTDFAARPEVDLLRRYVAIDTSYPDGDELAGARFLAAQLAAVGIGAEIEYLGRGRANLWAVIEGEERGALVLHHHIDVEPARPSEGWASAPFSGTIDGPWIWGRGVYDMKSLAVAQLVAFLDLQRSGVRPRRSVVLLATSSEETGSDVGAKWIVRQHPDLVSRFEVVLTEGGVVEAVSPTEVKYWGIENAQKHYADLVFCASDRARLDELAADLRQHGRDRAPVRLDPEVAEFARSFGPTRDFPRLQRIVSRPEALAGRPDELALLPRFLRSFFRNHLEVLPVRAAEGGGWELPLKLLVLPRSGLDEAIADTLPPGLGAGLPSVVRDLGGAGPGSPTSHPAFRALVETVRAAHPGVPVGPYVLAASATDARWFRRAGVPSYGFSPFVVVAADTFTAGQPNERMALHAFLDGVALYGEAVRRLVN